MRWKILRVRVTGVRGLRGIEEGLTEEEAWMGEEVRERHLVRRCRVEIDGDAELPISPLAAGG